METSMREPEAPLIDLRALNQLPDHTGQPRPAEVEFFAEPPPELGKLKSAESTLRPGGQAKPFATRLILGTVIGAALVGAAYWFGSKNPQDRDIYLVVGNLLGAAAFGITMFATRFKVVSSFVGADGVAKFTLKGQRSAKPEMQLLVFSQAEELRAKQIRQYVNGIYTGTNYDFVWTGPDGKRLWRANGSYRQRKKGLRPGEMFRFVQAAEVAWSVHYLERADKALQTEGSIPFRVDKNRVVHVGPGFLEFHFGGDPMRLTREDIASVSLGNGAFQFKHKDSKWYSLSGRYSFQYGTMANARVFQLALEKLMGYRWN